MLHIGPGRTILLATLHCPLQLTKLVFLSGECEWFYMVCVNRVMLLLHFWMQFWAKHFVVPLPCWLVVAVGNQLPLVYLLLVLSLPGTMLFRHKDILDMFICDREDNFFRILLGNYLCRYSNIFVTAPSPDNLKTLFEFILKGFEALDYKVQVLSLIDIYNNYCLNKIHLEIICFI